MQSVYKELSESSQSDGTMWWYYSTETSKHQRVPQILEIVISIGVQWLHVMAFVTMCWNRAVRTQCYKNIVTCNHCNSSAFFTKTSKFTCIRFCIKFGKLATVVLETLSGFWQWFFCSIIDFEWRLHFKANQMPVEDEHQGHQLLVKYGNYSMRTIAEKSICFLTWLGSVCCWDRVQELCNSTLYDNLFF